MFFVRSGFEDAQNVKISVLPTPYAHFRRFKGSRIHSKNGSKITKDLEKKHAWKCYVFCIRFFAFFFRFCLNFGSFWSSKGHLGAFKIKSFSNMAPRWSLRGLRGPSGVDFRSVLLWSWVALGAIFGFGFRIQCVFPARNPAWLSHTFFVFPMQRGGTCAAHGIETPGVIFHGGSDFRGIVFPNF